MEGFPAASKTSSSGTPGRLMDEPATFSVSAGVIIDFFAIDLTYQWFHAIERPDLSPNLTV